MVFGMSLPLFHGHKSLQLPRPPQAGMPSLAPDAPAIAAMTDFLRTPAISVPATTQIDIALERMIFSGVRLLFVVDADFSLLGSISSYDIQGEKPMLYLQSIDCRIAHCSRADVTVRDIMEPVARWKALGYETLSGASVQDVAQTFGNQSRRHLVVLEAAPGGARIVRGMFSATFLERALGMRVEIQQVADTFAEIERALVK